MFKWYPLLYDEKRSRGILNDKQTELSGGARMSKLEYCDICNKPTGRVSDNEKIS